MAHDIFKLDGEGPKTILSVETADISQFFKHGWYEWVKFCSTTIAILEVPLVHGKHLGPSIDLDPAMTTKILTPQAR